MGTKNGRDACGKFAEGNPGGPGRPRRDCEREYLAVLAEVCSLEDWREVTRRAVDDAKDGNPKAREWLASYLLGAPQAKAETLHGLAIDELRDRDPVTVDANRGRVMQAMLDQSDF